MRIGRAILSAASLIAPAERVPVEQTRRRLSGDGSAGRRRRYAASAIDELDLEARLHAHAILGADPPQERERLVIAAEQHVLAVVDPLAGLRIGERRGAPAEHGLRFEHEHTRAALRQPTAARRPAKPPPMTMTSGDLI